MVSGVYDLTPLLFTNVNDDIRLDEHGARALSPISQIPSSQIPMVVTVSENDTEEYRRQSLQWASAWAEVPGNLPPVMVQVLERNHFDVLYGLVDGTTALGRAVLRQLGLC